MTDEDEDPLATFIQRVNAPKAPEDGLSWLLDYVGRLLKTYPSFGWQFVWDELPMIQGWAMYAWSLENDFLVQWGNKRASRGYVAIEVEKLIAQAKEAWAKQLNE